MKHIIIAGILLLVIQNTQAQHLLTLDVTSLTDTSKIIIRADNRILNEKDTIFFKDVDWTLKINPHNNNFKIRIQTTTIPVNLIDLDISQHSDSMHIVNNNLNNNFSLPDRFEIIIINTVNHRTIKDYARISYLNKNESTSAARTVAAGNQSPEYTAGIIFYDAAYLNNIGNNIEVRKKILAHYAGLDDTADFAAIKIALTGNEFLKEYLNQMERELTVPRQQSSANALSFFSGSALGGVNVTNFADGFAKFLIKRFKEELSVGFFERFKKDITGSSYIELRTLFPQTYKLFLVINNELYNFDKYLNALQKAFIFDLGNLYAGIKKVKELPKYENYFQAHREINTAVINAFYFIDAYSNGVHPGKVLDDYPPDTYLNFADNALQTNMRSAVKTLQVFSRSLKSRVAKDYWMPADSVIQMLSNVSFSNIYFGLIYQQADAIEFETSAGKNSLKAILNAAKTDGKSLLEFQNYIRQVIDDAQEINDYVTAIRDKPKSEIDFTDYYKLFNASLDLLNHGFSITGFTGVDIDNAPRAVLRTQVTALTELAHTAADLYTDTRTKNYSSAVINLLSFLDYAIGDSMTVNKKLRENILKYASFAADVAAAQTSDDVKNAIDAVALPVGSSRVKRESVINISLNAYVGGTGGLEYLPALEKHRTSPTAAFTAQGGIAFSFGDLGRGKKENKGGKSITLFVPVIDAGALASFRFRDDSSKVASEVKLKNIFAPGFFFYYGFGKCPLSLGFGAQAGPQLRDVTAKNVRLEDNYYVRYGISLCVDIPLLNFYSKTK